MKIPQINERGRQPEEKMRLLLFIIGSLLLAYSLKTFYGADGITSLQIFQQDFIELSNQNINPNEILTITTNPKLFGFYNHVYILKDKNIVDEIILNNCDSICFGQQSIDYEIPSNFNGVYSAYIYDYSIEDYVSKDFAVFGIMPEYLPVSITRKIDWGIGPNIPQIGNPLKDLYPLNWSRVTANIWSKLQYTNGTYNWGDTDQKVREAINDSYNLIFVIKTGNSPIVSEVNCYNAVWNSTEQDKYLHSCPIKPQYENDWKELIHNFVERYDGDGINDMPGLTNNFEFEVEIENEAGNPTFWYFNEKRNGTLVANEYLKILRLAYEGKDLGNPSTKIILAGLVDLKNVAGCESGALSPAFCSGDFQTRNRVFTKEILKNPQYFDAVDAHFFNYFRFDTSRIPEGMTWLKTEISNNGYNKPIYVLEWNEAIMLGVFQGDHVSEFTQYFPYMNNFTNISSFLEMYNNLDAPGNEVYRAWFDSEQAREFPMVFTTILDNGAKRLLRVKFHDFARQADEWNDTWWNWVGIVKYSGNATNPILIKKPLYHTINIYMQKVDGYTSLTRLNFSNNIFVYEFTFNNKNPVYVAWTKNQSIILDLSQDILTQDAIITHIVKALDVNNNPIYLNDEIIPVISVPVSDTPIFIEESTTIPTTTSSTTTVLVVSNGTTSTSVPIMSSGGGGSSGGSSYVCKPNVVCGLYTECINGKQTRTCTDLNKCQADYKEVMYCSSSTIPAETTEHPTTSIIEQAPAQTIPELPTVVLYSIIAAVLSISSILIGVSFFMSRKRSKSKGSADSILKIYVEKALKQGYSKEQIEKAALEKGWPKHLVENLFK